MFFQHVQKNCIQVPLRTLAAVGAMSEASACTACTARLRRGWHVHFVHLHNGHNGASPWRGHLQLPGTVMSFGTRRTWHGNDMELIWKWYGNSWPVDHGHLFCSVCHVERNLNCMGSNSFHHGTIHVPLNLGSVLTRIHWRSSMALLDKMGGGQSQTVMFGGTGMCSSYFQHFFDLSLLDLLIFVAISVDVGWHFDAEAAEFFRIHSPAALRSIPLSGDPGAWQPNWSTGGQGFLLGHSLSYLYYL